MLNETRQLLNEFYEPYNQELADIMDDDQFLWEPEENDYESMEDKWISIPTIIFLKVKCEWIKIVRFQRFFFLCLSECLRVFQSNDWKVFRLCQLDLHENEQLTFLTQFLW